MEFASAVTDATPLDPMVAVVAERFAEAPLEGAVKVTTPPATGSTGFLAVTVKARGLVKSVSTVADCGVLPVTAETVNPWLWKAPTSGWGESRGSPRWSVVTPATAMPAPMAGLPGRRGTVWVGPP